MPQVATYVFLDLETTGLPSFEYNKTRITELSMVVVNRSDILDTSPGAAPRVQNKLTMCFNPRRMIHPESTEISGLSNYLLEHQTAFNINVFDTINSFLQCFEKPVCLVAQNGHSFDFPILKNHFVKLGVSLSDDILCADSLYAFYDILESRKNQDKTSKTNAPVVDITTNPVETDESSVDQKQDRQMSDTVAEEAKASSYKQLYNTQTEELITEEVLKDFEENNDLNSQQLLKQQNEKTPQKKQQVLKPLKKISKVKRKIFFGNKLKPVDSYQLKDVYMHVLRRPAIEAHRAENDCIMAMEVAVGIAKEFVAWVDNEDNQCKFSEVNPMKVGVPIGN